MFQARAYRHGGYGGYGGYNQYNHYGHYASSRMDVDTDSDMVGQVGAALDTFDKMNDKKRKQEERYPDYYY